MSSRYDEFVARVEQNTMHETIYTDSEGRTIVVIVMEDLFNHFELKERGKQGEQPVGVRNEDRDDEDGADDYN
jgi:hypothetical protein